MSEKGTLCPWPLAFALCGAILLCSATLVAAAAEHPAPEVRRAILAGTWYPANPAALSQQVRAYLSRVRVPPPAGKLRALVVPHAGYVYSGAVAAHAYALVRRKKFHRVVLVGPSHRAAFRGVSVNRQPGYETPLGTVPVDLEAAEGLLKSGPLFRSLPRAHAREHSLEIQLPFLQVVLQNTPIVPILMGSQDPDTCEELAEALASFLARDPRTLLVASSDLSHFHAEGPSRKLDARFIARLREMDPRGLLADLGSGRAEACGGGPVAAVLSASLKRGADRCVILRHANSGDITGDRKRVVGYLAAALFKSSGRDPRPR